MGTNTTNYSFYKPADDGTGWGSNVNDSFDDIDSLLNSHYVVVQSSGSLNNEHIVSKPVTGPASSTDNALVRFDGTSGSIVQDSGATISDGGEIAVAGIDLDGNLDASTQATDVTVIDNNSSALSVKEGSNEYITIDTTDNAEKVKLLQDIFTDRWLGHDSNVVIGVDAMGSGNLSHGSGAEGYYNIAIGREALEDITTGESNIAIGEDALTNLTTGTYNTAIGRTALSTTTDSDENTAIGTSTLYAVASGGENVAVGNSALYQVSSGSQNVALGAYAGQAVSGSSTGNVLLGYSAGQNESGSNKLYIDNSNTSNPLIYGEFDNDIARVNGNLGYKVVSTSGSSYNADKENVILCDATSGSISVNLPAAASSEHRVYTVKKTDSSGNNVIIDGNASEEIDGATTQTLSSQYDARTVACDGSAWYIIASV